MSNFLASKDFLTKEEELALLEDSEALLDETSNNLAPEEAEMSFEEEIGLTYFLNQEDPEGKLVLRNKALTNFIATLKRLDENVKLENTLLEDNDFSRLKDLNNRKTRGLHDLNLALSQLSPFETKEIKKFLKKALLSLQVGLKRNQDLLKMHLEAVTEVAGIIEEVETAREDDGTYASSYKGNVE